MYRMRCNECGRLVERETPFPIPCGGCGGNSWEVALRGPRTEWLPVPVPVVSPRCLLRPVLME